jgi:hypothetical protein
MEIVRKIVEDQILREISAGQEHRTNIGKLEEHFLEEQKELRERACPSSKREL